MSISKLITLVGLLVQLELDPLDTELTAIDVTLLEGVGCCWFDSFKSSDQLLTGGLELLTAFNGLGWEN